MFESLWIERYRPKVLADIVLTDRVKQELEKYRASGEIPHLLFLSGPGQGKTSLAKIIVTELLDCSTLYINASDENGIDTIRSKIMGFASTKSLDGKLKVVILDEADGLTQQAQQALRNVMEEYANNVRFVITANYAYKVITPIQSRCQAYDLNPPIEGVISRIGNILRAEKITCDADEKVKLLQLIRNTYPDVRKIVNLVQKNVIDGKLVIQFHNQGLDFASTIVQKALVEQLDVTAIRRFIIENDMKYNRDYHALLKDIFNAIDLNPDFEIIKKRKYLTILAEHMFRHTFVMDPEINAYAAIISICEV